MLLALVPGTLALSAHPRIPISHRCAAPRMTFLSGREDLNEASGELRASGRAGAVREAVPRAAAGGSPVTEQMPATWADAAERLAEMRAMQELNEKECVIEEPCMPDGGIVLLRHGESEWNAANRYHAKLSPSPSTLKRRALSKRSQPQLACDVDATRADVASPLVHVPSRTFTCSQTRPDFTLPHGSHLQLLPVLFRLLGRIASSPRTGRHSFSPRLGCLCEPLPLQLSSFAVMCTWTGPPAER